MVDLHLTQSKYDIEFAWIFVINGLRFLTVTPAIALSYIPNPFLWFCRIYLSRKFLIEVFDRFLQPHIIPHCPILITALNSLSPTFHILTGKSIGIKMERQDKVHTSKCYFTRRNLTYFKITTDFARLLLLE